MVSHVEELRADVHPDYPSLEFVVSTFGGSLPKPRFGMLRFGRWGLFKGPKHLEFINGAQTLPLFIPSILDVLQASPFGHVN